ncbi:MAG: hypothetical protein ACI31D_05730, partial [Candidatus Limisoma sp.]
MFVLIYMCIFANERQKTVYRRDLNGKNDTQQRLLMSIKRITYILSTLLIVGLFDSNAKET